MRSFLFFPSEKSWKAIRGWGHIARWKKEKKGRKGENGRKLDDIKWNPFSPSLPPVLSPSITHTLWYVSQDSSSSALLWLSWCVLLRQRTMFQRVSFLPFFTCSLVCSMADYVSTTLQWSYDTNTFSLANTFSHYASRQKRNHKEREGKSLFPPKLCND